MRILIFILTQVWFVIGLSAQSFDYQLYTPFFNQYQQLKESVNPAMVTFENKASVDLAVQFHPGTFSNFNSTYFSFGLRLNRNKEKKVTQVVGLQMKNDSEGKLLNRNFLYGHYALSLPINQHYDFSGGMQLGLASINFQSTSITPGSSSHALDGNIGVQLYSKNTRIGLSYNQFLGSQLINLGETNTLKSYVGLFVGKQFSLTPDWGVGLNFLHQTDDFHTTAINSEMIYMQKMLILLNWNNRRGAGVGGGLKELKVGKQVLFFNLVYYFSVFNKAMISTNEFELVVKLSF